MHIVFLEMFRSVKRKNRARETYLKSVWLLRVYLSAVNENVFQINLINHVTKY